jgi:hypothetical protein
VLDCGDVIDRGLHAIVGQRQDDIEMLVRTICKHRGVARGFLGHIVFNVMRPLELQLELVLAAPLGAGIFGD